MKRLILRAVLVAVTTLYAHAGWSLGLGEISLYSYLNEPLRAELLLLETDGLEVADLRLGLAAEQEYERLGVDRAQFLQRLAFDVQVVDAAIQVMLTTELPLREPYLNFVVEARWPEGRLLREYTLLIDLPPTAAEVTAEVLSRPASSEIVRPEKRSSGADADGENEIRPGGSYRVRNSDTLWRIASLAKTENVTIDQAMLAIVRANPHAFDGENVNGLKSGYLLSFPTGARMSIPSREASAEVARQNAAWSNPGRITRPGLKLVADTVPTTDQPLAVDTEDAVALASVFDEESATPEAAVKRAPPALGIASSPEFDALLIKVEALEQNLLRMEQQLKQRDSELEALRTQLLAATTRSEMSIGFTPASSEEPSRKALPIWLLLGALGLLILGALAVWWSQRGRLSSRSNGVDVMEQPAQSEVLEVAYHEDLPLDPQIRAAKALKEADIYFAYGRPDQAEEVLSAAFCDGATSPSLVLRLLECHVEQGHFEEVQSLMAHIHSGTDADLIERGFQVLRNAGVMLAPAPENISGSIDVGPASYDYGGSFDGVPSSEEVLPGSLYTEQAMESGAPVQGERQQGIAANVSDRLLDSPARVSPPSVPGVDREFANTEESIYGAETDPVDSKLDLARAYLDMGDEEGARLVLDEVVREGNLSQQAEARELLLRLELS